VVDNLLDQQVGHGNQMKAKLGFSPSTSPGTLLAGKAQAAAGRAKHHNASFPLSGLPSFAFLTACGRPYIEHIVK
jgi:hypothetical protein